jgi:hypothetical protein
MTWYELGLYYFAIFAEAMLYLYSACCLIYALYYFGRLLIKKLFSNQEDT